MSNVAEGFGRGGRSEFNQFLVVAKASCAEVRSQLYVAHELGYIDQKYFEDLTGITDKVSRIVGLGHRSAISWNAVRLKLS